MAASGIRLVFLDTPGTIGPEIEVALAASHFILIPAAPTAADLKASLPTARAAHRLEKPFAFVLTSCPSSSQRISQAEELLTRLGAIAGEPLHRRVAYQDAYAQGLGVVEQKADAHAAREIVALWEWLKTKLNSLGWDC